jgi:hypothetical protein
MKYKVTIGGIGSKGVQALASRVKHLLGKKIGGL